MNNLAIWLYRYITIHTSHILRHVLAGLDSLAPSPMYRLALQRARTPVSSCVSNSRLRRHSLTP
jgi:hypothetical protein